MSEEETKQMLDEIYQDNQIQEVIKKQKKEFQEDVEWANANEKKLLSLRSQK